MFLPTPRLLFLCSVALVLPILSLLAVVPAHSIYLVDGGFLVLVLGDLVLLSFRTGLSFRLTMRGHSWVRDPLDITLRIVNRGSSKKYLSVNLQLGVAFQPAEEQRNLVSMANSVAQLRWVVMPIQRGRHQIPPLTLRISTHLGLLTRQIQHLPSESTHCCYPRQVLTREEKRLVKGLASDQVGALYRRYFSKGTEFDQLRYYTKGDDYRNIDWKSSARSGRHIVRTYRPEANQRVMVFLDLGRQMRPTQAGATNLEWTIEAAQILFRVAAQEGDHVGLLAFGSTIRAYARPDRGSEHLRALAEKVTDLKAEPVEPDYRLAANYFHKTQKRRSLVALFTQVQDREGAVLLQRSMQGLRPKHFPLVINVVEKDIALTRKQFPDSEENVFRKAAATEVNWEIERFEKEMRANGVSMLTVDPERMLVETLNRYLEIKRTGLL